MTSFALDASSLAGSPPRPAWSVASSSRRPGLQRHSFAQFSFQTSERSFSFLAVWLLSSSSSFPGFASSRWEQRWTSNGGPRPVCFERPSPICETLSYLMFFKYFFFQVTLRSDPSFVLQKSVLLMISSFIFMFLGAFIFGVVLTQAIQSLHNETVTGKSFVCPWSLTTKLSIEWKVFVANQNRRTSSSQNCFLGKAMFYESKPFLCKSSFKKGCRFS